MCVDIVLNVYFCFQYTGFLKSPAEGAETSINAAINPDLKGVRDIYYSNCKPTNTHSDARYGVWCTISFLLDQVSI